ncbi:MAG: hypothetical protein IPN86_19755 [Saprospiraceae bacterium]|nr:hypothetical protein [Saprospiraceae bacterium]
MLQNSDMFKKIKSIFVIEEQGGAKVNETIDQQSVTESSPVAKNTNVPSPTVARPATPTDTRPDAKFTDLLLKAIESNNLEGFDYLEFKILLSR